MPNWASLAGDPDPLGWITTGAYLVAALAACRAAHRRTASAERREPRSDVYWSSLVALLTALGINKQLDLQSLLTATARRIAVDGGWYDQRRELQAALIAAISVTIAAAAIALMRHVARSGHCERLAAVGAVMLLGFILARAATFHHAGTILDANVAHLVELAGVGLIGATAFNVSVSVTRRPD